MNQLTTIEAGAIARDAGPGAARSGKLTTFTFGDAEGVMDRRQLLECVEIWNNGRWYEPPISFHGLVRAFDVAPHHASCIRLKRNLLVKHLIPSRWLDREQFGRWALDYLVLGNGFVERRDNLAGRPLQMVHSLARYTRRGVVDGRYFFVPAWKQEYEFRPDSVFQLSEAHPSQEIYGLPEYLSAMQSAFLNEASTLFRRRYYLNGSHAGFVFYLNEGSVSNEDSDAIRQALKESKGVGNFRNLFLHAPNGKKDGVQIIPISEVAAKDEFLGIKNTTRDDMLASHRVPPQLLGVVPTNSGGFGDVGKATDVFFENEIEPLMEKFTQLNDWLGVEAVVFKPYERVSVGAGGVG